MTAIVLMAAVTESYWIREIMARQDARRRGELAEVQSEIEKAGQGRRQAPCPHYGRCGGCTLEHLEYMAQLRQMVGQR